MKKIFKLLCYSLITVFLLGLGGEKVLAEPSSFKVNQGDKWVDLSDNLGYNWWSNVKTINGGEYNGKYVFCLDSHKHIFTTGNMKKYTGNPMELSSQTPYIEGYTQGIANVLMRAYSLGLGNGQENHTFNINDSKSITLSEKELYGVTQSAVWFKAHGDSEDDGVGLYKKYWLSGKLKDTYNYLVASDNFSYYLNVTSNGDVTMSESGNNLVSSGEYTIDSNIPTSFLAIVNGGEMKINDGNWTSAEARVQNGDKIKLRTAKPEGQNAGEVSVELTVSSGEFVDGYDVYLYEADTNDSKLRNKSQNLVFPIEHTGTKSVTVTAFGNYTDLGNIKVRKIDSETGKPIYGAGLVLVRKPSSTSTSETIIDTFITRYDEDNLDGWIQYSDLNPGYYCLKEDVAPDGYALNDTDDTDDTNDGIVSCGKLERNQTLELVKADKMQRVKYRKVDAQGRPIAGVRVELHNSAAEVGNKSTPYLCGVSDDRGYLTIPCEGASNNSKIISPAADGTFPLGWIIKDGNLTYVTESQIYVKETFKNGYYDPKLDDDNVDFGFANIYNSRTGSTKYGFGYSGPADQNGEYPCKFHGDFTTDEVVEVWIENDRYVKISKQDTGTGKEVKGAEMLLCDLSSSDYSVASELELSTEQVPYSCVDKWTSDGSDHTFIGVVPGHIYSLTEITPPKGYQTLETQIKFKVSEDGKVELVDATQYVNDHATIPDRSSYYLIINNDLLVDTPSTGVSILNKVAIGGLLVFVGYEIIKFRNMKANS